MTTLLNDVNYEYNLLSREEIFAMACSLHPASNSSLPVFHTNIRFLFHHCTSLLKIFYYFLSYRIKVRRLSLMFRSSRVNPNLCASLIFDSFLTSSFCLMFFRTYVAQSTRYCCGVNWGHPGPWGLATARIPLEVLGLVKTIQGQMCSRADE